MRWHRRSASSGRDGSPGTRRQGAEIPPGQCLGSTPREQGLMGRDARQGLLPEGANASPLRAMAPTEAPTLPSPRGGGKFVPASGGGRKASWEGNLSPASGGGRKTRGEKD